MNLFIFLKINSIPFLMLPWFFSLLILLQLLVITIYHHLKLDLSQLSIFIPVSLKFSIKDLLFRFIFIYRLFDVSICYKFHQLLHLLIVMLFFLCLLIDLLHDLYLLLWIKSDIFLELSFKLLNELISLKYEIYRMNFYRIFFGVTYLWTFP